MCVYQYIHMYIYLLLITMKFLMLFNALTKNRQHSKNTFSYWKIINTMPSTYLGSRCIINL